MSYKNFSLRMFTKAYTFIIRKEFYSFGKGSKIRPFSDLLVGKKYICVGSNTTLGKHIQLTAWSSINGEKFTPEITIGSNCRFGSYNHITAINRIRIGDGVLTGKFVTISDNSHGKTDQIAELKISPTKRSPFSKGAVEIGDNVWLGDKVTILANVKIGEGSIIGANAVVTKDIPPFSVAAGNPARIIRRLDK